ncbi:conserved Plasmodium protein, unknown function [Plasmodium gallinaceum]|uniref:RNA polymerase sigma-70 region 3 domain-containing protein n=1 Tax=Plasmodium gallinaceum TaxID=5849 RepID=A0A1J1GRX2_PLAGA|nr:conserved Plasmodium protein, unknown function [Plasmodium gallinaceum]CRG93786.1 conserved Plasmodium protein, unknown function [Plasmodium gallinaceum]
MINAKFNFLSPLIILIIINNFNKKKEKIYISFFLYIYLFITFFYFKKLTFIETYQISQVKIFNNDFVNIVKNGRKKKKILFRYKNISAHTKKGKESYIKEDNYKDIKNIENNKVRNIRKINTNNYFNSLCHSNALIKYIDENVNFNDGVINYFVLNSNPNINFLVNNIKEKKVCNTNKKKLSDKNYNNESILSEIQKYNNNIENNNINNIKNEKIRLKLKRGYMNEIYDKEKRKLNNILLSLKDKSIFKKNKNKIKENILLLNGQIVKTEVIKQYLFHKLRLEYYESIRDQKKILTLDLWSKEINVSVDNLKKLIIYIYKMKNLVQKEDEDLLVKTYFYNKTNMFTLFRNINGDNNITYDFSITKEITNDDNKENEEKKEEKKKKKVIKEIHEKHKELNSKTYCCNMESQSGYENNKENIIYKNNEQNKDSEMEQINEEKQELPNIEVKKKYNIFDDYFENAKTPLYNDCENLINTEVQKFIECIKDIVFFENSIYMLEKLENRPPLMEELIYAYNYDKENFLKGLENKIKLSQKLLIYFIPLIKNIVRKAEANFSSNLSEEDFLLVSLESVKNGFKKYDIEKLGIKNLTKYVYIWAKNSTYNYYQKHKSFISISPHTYKDYNKIKNFEEAFLEKNNRKPNIKEISEGLKMSIEKVEKVLSSTVNIIDAEKPIVYQNKNSENPEKNTYKDLIVNSDDIHSFNEIMYNDLVIKGLRNFICKSIKKKINKLIIFMKFGLFLNKKIYTDDETCETLKISKKKFQKYFQDSMSEIKNFIKQLKKNKSQLDSNFDFASYISFSQYDFLGNEFSQITA